MSAVVRQSREKSWIQQLFFPGYLLHNESNLPELSVLFRLPPRITFRE